MRAFARRGIALALLVAGCGLGDIGGAEDELPGPAAAAGPRAGNGQDGGASTPSSSTGSDAAMLPSGSDAGPSVTQDGAPNEAAPVVTPGVRDLTSNRALFFGASRCAQANVQLCEDFESGTLDTKVWEVGGTAPTIDAMQKARGGKALHIKQQGNGSSFIREKKTFPAVNDNYFGRAFFYFTQMPSPPGMTFSHWTILAASGTQVQGEIRVGGFLTNDKLLFGVGTDSYGSAGGTGDWTTIDADPAGSPKVIPLNQWVCVEWEHRGQTNETRFFWDAVEHASLHTTADKNGGNGNPYILPQFTELWIGWAEYQPSDQTFELWVDEIAIDKERIGCVL